MSANQIGLEIPQKELSFKIGSEKNSFSVVVVNNSDQFASFQLELIAAGADVQTVGYEWYKISPDVSVKIPPGDLVEFVVSIIETPIPGFMGIMNVTVQAVSMELREENREIIRINLQAGGTRSQLKVEIPSQKLQVTPLESVEIPIVIGNTTQQSTNVTLNCLGLPESWFPKGHIQQFAIKPGGIFKTSFLCTLPFDHEAVSKIYPFAIDVIHTNGLPSHSECSLEVLPKGSLEFICSEKVLTIPPKSSWKEWKSWWKFWQAPPAIFPLIAKNASNIAHKVNFDIENIATTEDFSYEVSPNEAEVEPFSEIDFNLQIDKSRPWFGKAKKLNLLVKANWQDPRVNTNDEIQSVELSIKPIIPFIFIIILTGLTLFVSWYFSFLNPYNPFPPHKAPVTSVQYDGKGTFAVSSSNDRTLRKWFIEGFYNPLLNQEMGVIANPKKAIRIARFRPVHNDLVAAGLENGEIQIWDANNEVNRPLATFSNQADDRVFGLAYTLDSRTLFSGHGSGTLLRWDLQDLFTNPPTQPTQAKKFDFAISSIALVGQDDNVLAIAGRYNQLLLWNWVKDSAKTLTYPQLGGQDDYIQSIAVPDRRRNLLATADNQGAISVWDLNACLQSNIPCQVIDSWTAHSGKPVRSVAFSLEGCYLVSSGDDGMAKLWTLTQNGKRTGDVNGKILETRPVPIGAVDIHLTSKEVLTLTGTNAGRVLGQKTDRIFNLGCDKP
ncbi:WD40 repeat domain-containing protein [Pseudanabaena yagii]|uniref:WD40 repeat domain-containing protein n=1 Tax=Pseudanabaena yagii GIHE-NHR1 TaxID=2722753 RepID=A0ABX1LU63_9CYAN|nr:hypothetical protein [Pseudanabaena yagii]NMF59703.1 hypothetical protein [Pseudanabaena yagii GIHE-NHR1]